MIEPTTRVVCDAGPIIHLDELKCLDLLHDFQEVILPMTVSEEIRRNRPSALKTEGWSFTTLTQNVFPDDPLLTICRIFSLDLGETEALAIMQKNPQAMFLTDDASARLAAEQVGFKVHGTIGVLIRSIRRGQRTPEQVVATVAEIPAKSILYVKAALLKEIVNRIRNEFNM